MSKKQVMQKLGGAFLGAVMLTTPTLFVGRTVVENKYLSCIDFSKTENPFRCIQDLNTLGTAVDLALMFSIVGGGVGGWRTVSKRNEKKAEGANSDKAGPSDPEV